MEEMTNLKSEMYLTARKKTRRKSQSQMFKYKVEESTNLISEMYLTARRQTRREPQTIPESRGLSQYTRERT